MNLSKWLYTLNTAPRIADGDGVSKALFEAHVKRSMPGMGPDFERGEDGNYECTLMQTSWHDWCVAWSYACKYQNEKDAILCDQEERDLLRQESTYLPRGQPMLLRAASIAKGLAREIRQSVLPYQSRFDDWKQKNATLKRNPTPRS